jgi:hypothetical protein
MTKYSITPEERERRRLHLAAVTAAMTEEDLRRRAAKTAKTREERRIAKEKELAKLRSMVGAQGGTHAP